MVGRFRSTDRLFFIVQTCKRLKHPMKSAVAVEVSRFMEIKVNNYYTRKWNDGENPTVYIPQFPTEKSQHDSALGECAVRICRSLHSIAGHNERNMSRFCMYVVRKMLIFQQETFPEYNAVGCQSYMGGSLLSYM